MDERGKCVIPRIMNVKGRRGDLIGCGQIMPSWNNANKTDTAWLLLNKNEDCGTKWWGTPTSYNRSWASGHGPRWRRRLFVCKWCIRDYVVCLVSAFYLWCAFGDVLCIRQLHDYNFKLVLVTITSTHSGVLNFWMVQEIVRHCRNVE